MKEKRLISVICLFTAIAFLIELNMVKIAVDEQYYSNAYNQQYKELQIDECRGDITDINFNKITNTTVQLKTLVTVQDKDLQQVFNVLEEYEKVDFYDNLEYRRNFIADIQEIPGNRKTYKSEKRYTDFNIAQHLIGYIDGEGNGVSGLEKVFDEQLRDAKKADFLKLELNGYGEILSAEEISKMRDTDKLPQMLTLTTDNTIQRLCEGIAKEYIPNGSVVVMESKTGKIKAMVSTPFYSANNVAQALNQQNSPLLNKALQSYEPGSVIKPLWAAVLMENGYNPDRVYDCTGTITVNDHEYHCANNKAHGPVDMRQALTVSCNCYFINACRGNKARLLYEMAETTELGKAIQLTQEYFTKAGYFPTEDELKNAGQLASVSFGQGKILLTPVHVLAYINMFANNGIYVQPQIVQGIYNAQTKELIKNYYDYNAEQMISPKTAAAIKEMLKSVVEEGAMKRAKPDYLSAGGKTGTAQTGRYNENGSEIFTAWFCGFYPYDNPQYTICITMYNGGESTRTAAPVFKKICDSLYYLI
ncbi:MAG: penicillin-binding protein 2 [Oscillospiraceae bacterium]|nr:penicillin-binding protein 2 [Oscillospiraceae bacterium]